ncbi:MAG: hypothetical protein WBP18_05350 [Paracoccaceae bacterium]
MLRAIPGFLATVFSGFWAFSALNVAVGSSYYPNSPYAELATLRLLLGAFAVLAALVLLVRHVLTRRLGLSRCIAETAVVVGGLVAAVPLWGWLFPPEPFRQVVFAGETYAIPIGYAPFSQEEQGDTPAMLSFSLCVRGPVYATDPCLEALGFALSRRPVETEDYLQIVLHETGARIEDGRVVDSASAKAGQDSLVFDGTYLTSTLHTAADGRILSALTCDIEWSGPCHAAIAYDADPGNGKTAFFDVSHGHAIRDELAMFTASLARWRCPKAQGCLNEK